MHADGSCACLKSEGFPLGLMADADFEECSAQVRHGDRLLLSAMGCGSQERSGRSARHRRPYRDSEKAGVSSREYPEEALEEALLKYSNSIRLDDDLTIIEVRF